jgi:hypothetical protein
MSAFDHLPLIDVTAYFNDPSIPDGANVGFVNENGIVFREGKAIGRDQDHPAFRMDRLRLAVDHTQTEQKTAKPRREVVTLFERAGARVAIDSENDLWILEGKRWGRLLPVDHLLPPLPQE